MTLAVGLSPGILGVMMRAVVLADAGMLRPVVDTRRFTRRTVAQAHQAVEDGTAASKIVVDIAE
jgi:NADPH2:quinone reductase